MITFDIHTTPTNMASTGDSHAFTIENEVQAAQELLLERRVSELLGGALPGELDLSRVRRVLDVGCGVGGWVYEMAWRHPDVQLIGIDKRAYFIEQALGYVWGGISNVIYLVQDALHLEGAPFEPESFDLVHMRLLGGEIVAQDYPPLLRALAVLCRPGGLIAWTEMEFPLTSSPACQHLWDLLQQGLRKAGRAFAPGSALGITAHMNRWLEAAGCHLILDKAHLIDISSGASGPTDAHQTFQQRALTFVQQVRPFLLELGLLSEPSFKRIVKQMQQEIQEETFSGVCYLRSVVGEKAPVEP
ncbi:MAG: class I SAM-dependent methyltransferase [Ktedonobacteraceae bacterium]